ncbi:MAG: ribonuclease P protein component [Treponema sp.]|nr:ribonuclease P protein component [Treponema sp.]
MGRFKREEHLKGRTEIKEVFSKGKRYGCPGAKLFVLKNDLPFNRICFTLTKGKGFKTAVSRNRAKRLGREAFRLMKPGLKNGYDLILLVYPESGDVCPQGKHRLQSRHRLQDRQEQLGSLFQKAGLLK